ncbi:uncharacterized protein LOC132734069, partial [Ruditapes philippinarum]|uniref:uncharacterized protein LOC132734069 n=1 Tax=Ruditapes philippinarum TaxID=129788 RepID=UPI00295BBA86
MIMIYSDLDLDVDTVQMASVCESLNIRKSDESLFKTVIVDGLNKDQKDALLDNILNFAKAVKKEKREYHWVFLLPYIHVLSGLCDPYANVKMDLSYETDQWWGVYGGKMKMMVNTTAKNEDPCSEPNAISNISSKIYTLFEFDYLLPRTILASLQLLELKEAIKTMNYPIYTCLASILTRMKTLSHERGDKTGKGKKIVGECVEDILKSMKSVPYKQPIKEKDYATLLAGVFASYLVVESTHGYTKKIVCCCWEIFLLCISTFNSLMNASSDGTHDGCFALVKDTSCKIINWMNTQNFSLKEEIGTWNALFLSEDTSIYTNKALDDALTEAALRNLKRRS